MRGAGGAGVSCPPICSGYRLQHLLAPAFPAFPWGLTTWGLTTLGAHRIEGSPQVYGELLGSADGGTDDDREESKR